jgi:ribonuclease Y
MNEILAAALGALVVASAAFFFLGRRIGRTAEIKRLATSKSTAEETAQRIVTESEREAENLRKSAVVAGKEELIRLREKFESEVRGRREEVEREERRINERETVLDRKSDVLEQRDRELGRRASEFGRREKTVVQREEELANLVAEERRRLEQMAGM